MTGVDNVMEKIEESTRDAARIQIVTLQSILDHNSGVAYLHPYLNLSPKPVDVSTFRRSVPLSSYQDYSELVNRMADGDPDDPPLLSVDPLVCFFNSSGTSCGRPKLIPHFDSAASKSASRLAHLASDAIIKRLFPPRPFANKIMWFLYAGNITHTKNGLRIMPATAFPLRQSPSPPFLESSTSPKEVILGSNFHDQTYCHLLCGLRRRDSVDGIRAPYAIALVKALAFLESNWGRLCDDLESGGSGLELSDPAMRDSVLAGPEPELSKTLREVFTDGHNWVGIVRRLWPNARYIRCVTTGGMEPYYHRLKRYAGEIPVLCGDYLSSECFVALNLDVLRPPGSARFVIIPFAAYFEFLPADSGGESRVSGSAEDAVDLTGVEVGRTYEMVVTTYRGLYRYRLGDVVRISGFYNSSPEVEFLTRSSSDVVEKLLVSEMRYFESLLGGGGAEVVEFAGFFEKSSGSKLLKVFAEVKRGSLVLMEGDEGVGDVRRCWELVRDRRRLEEEGVGLSELCVVKPGSFDCLLQRAMEKGVTPSQYKAPKIIKSSEDAEFLESCSLFLGG